MFPQIISKNCFLRIVLFYQERSRGTTGSDSYCRMADFQLRTLKAIVLAFGRSKIRNSEEHSNAQEIYLKRYLDIHWLVTLWDLWLNYGPEDLPMNYLFPLLPAHRQMCYMIGDFLSFSGAICIRVKWKLLGTCT